MLYNYIRRIWANFSSIQSRGYAAGIALSFPIIAHALPTSFKFIDYLVFVPLLIHLIIHKVEIPKYRYKSHLFIILFLVLALNTLGLFTSDSAYALQTLKDIFRTIILFGFFCVSLDPKYRPEKMIDGLFSAIVVVSAISAPLGIYKMILYENGFLVKDFLISCAERYPQGAALCGDYNMFGLNLLLATTGVAYFVVRTQPSLFISIIPLTLVTLQMTAGLYAGSKRFLLLFPIFSLITVAFLIWKSKVKSRGLLYVLPFILASYFFITDPFRNTNPKQNSFVLLESVFETNLAEMQKKPHSSIDDLRKLYITPRAVDAHAMATTVSAEEAYGFNSRIQRWVYALELLKENYLVGMGFNYHSLYSCKFTDCTNIDYPHFTVFSAGLISGIAGVLVVGAFYILFLFQTFSIGRAGWRNGISPFCLMIMPYSLLSGDTLLSVPQTISAVLILEAYRLTQNKHTGLELQG